MTVPVLPLWIGGKEVPSRQRPHRRGLRPGHRRGDPARSLRERRRGGRRRSPRPGPRSPAGATPRRSAGPGSWRASGSCSRRTGTSWRGSSRQEHGKTLPDAAGSVQRGIEVVEFASGAPHLLKGEWAEDVARGVDSHSVLQPVGVCAGITPFNFPAMVPLWMFPVAIACGNTFVLKPSEKVPSTALRHGPHLPRGRAAGGRPQRGAGRRRGGRRPPRPPRRERGLLRRLHAHRPARLRDRGAHREAGPGARRGAKNHAVVLPDAELEFTADALIGAGYGSAGERCMAISVVVAVGEVAEPLVARLREKAAALKVGPGHPGRRRDGAARHRRAPGAHPRHHRRRRGRGRQGGPRRPRAATCPAAEQGFFLGPTLLDHVTPGDDRLPGGDLRPGARGGPGAHARRGHRAREPEPLRQRDGDLHRLAAARPSASSTRSRWAWWASTSPSPCPWPSSRSAGGSSRSSATSTSTGWRA